MARGGITQTEVADARQRLINKGLNPSIDAIRSELGDTGSKTTISNHLKKLDESQPAKLSKKAPLSEPITQLIEQIAAQLKQESNELIEQQTEIHAEELAQLHHKLAEQKQQHKAEQEKNIELDSALELLRTEHAELSTHHSTLELELNQANQENKHLQQTLNHNAAHIKSLEDKHQHARESLEHYRTSVKEARDQDIRRHEQQVQQLQVEQRNLQQSLVIKQDELSQATAEQTRLFTELREARKQIEQLSKSYQKEFHESRNQLERLSSKHQNEQRQHGQLIEANTVLAKEYQSLKSQLDEAQIQLAEHETMTLKVRDLQIELATKNDLLDRFSRAPSEGKPEQKKTSSP